MNPLRKRLAKQNLLQALVWADGFAVPEATLRPHVDAMVRPPLKDAEWADLITDLSTGEYPLIKQIPDELDPKLIQWAITARGKTVLATL